MSSFSQEDLAEEVVEIEREGHAQDALGRAHQIRVPVQGLDRVLVVARAEQRQHPIGRRTDFGAGVGSTRRFAVTKRRRA